MTREDAEPATLEYATAAPPPRDPVPLRRRLAAEFVGTFLLVFFGCGSMAVDAAYGGAVGHVGVGLVWGLVVAAMIYAVGDVSGAHLNPAVSFAFWLAGRFRGRDALAYSGVQVAGATAASLLLVAAFVYGDDVGQTRPYTPIHEFFGEYPSSTSPPPPAASATQPVDSEGGSSVTTNTVTLSIFMPASTLPVGPRDVARAFGFEVVLTFALVFVILCVAVGSKERGLMAGIAIGATVAICSLAAGPVCRASMNPARSIGPAVAAWDFQYLWLYCTAPFLGAAVAVGAWTYIYRHPRPGL